MALYTDNIKTDLDSNLTWLDVNRYTGSYRLAGGAPVRTTELPVTGWATPEVQLTKAKEVMSSVNPYTACLIGSITQRKSQNSDNDVPNRSLGRLPSMTMFFDVLSGDGNNHKKVAFQIPYFNTPSASGNVTDAAATLAAILTPLIRCFGVDDIVHFSGATAS